MNRYGVKMKKRTKEQLDQEYSNLGVTIGHKMRIISSLEDEIASDLDKMKKLNIEASQLVIEEAQAKEEESK